MGDRGGLRYLRSFMGRDSAMRKSAYTPHHGPLDKMESFLAKIEGVLNTRPETIQDIIKLITESENQ